VHRDEFDFGSIGLSKFSEHLPNGNELFIFVVHVVLIHFVSQDREIVLVSDPDDCLNVLSAEHIAGGVSRVDYYNSSGNHSLLFSLFDLLIQSFYADTPTLVFLKIVRD